MDLMLTILCKNIWIISHLLIQSLFLKGKMKNQYLIYNDRGGDNEQQWQSTYIMTKSHDMDRG